MRNQIKLQVRCYAYSLIGINEYLDAFPGSKSNDNMGKTDLNKIILKSMPNRLSKQAYVQVFIVKLLLLINMVICLNGWKLQKQSMKVL